MSKNKVDVQALTEEIDRRKKEGVKVVDNLDGAVAKNKWIGELVTSVKTGSITETTEKIKGISKRTEHMEVNGGTVQLKEGAPKKFDSTNLMKHVESQPEVKTNNRRTVNHHISENVDREENMFNDFTKMKTGGLSDAISSFTNKKNNVSEVQHHPNQQTVLNEDVINKNITAYMNSNVAPLLEQAMKNTVVEMYSVDRVKRVLKENPEIVETYIKENPQIIEGIVINTIKKLQKRNQNK
jgi:hypothetical protein